MTQTLANVFMLSMISRNQGSALKVAGKECETGMSGEVKIADL